MIISEETYLSNKTPRFIVLDGVNGAGKTTLQRKICEYFGSRGLKAHPTREPGATELGKAIRSLVLTAKRESIVDRAEMFLFAADRAQHVDTVIKPILARGEIVISDRYFYSSLAFQGFGRQYDINTIWNVNSIAIDQVVPDLVILLDLDPAAGILRNKKEGAGSTKDGPDSFEEEEISFHQRIRTGFLTLAKDRPEPFLVCDASQSAENVWQQVKVLYS